MVSRIKLRAQDLCKEDTPLRVVYRVPQEKPYLMKKPEPHFVSYRLAEYENYSCVLLTVTLGVGLVGIASFFTEMETDPQEYY